MLSLYGNGITDDFSFSNLMCSCAFLYDVMVQFFKRSMEAPFFVKEKAQWGSIPLFFTPFHICMHTTINLFTYLCCNTIHNQWRYIAIGDSKGCNFNRQI